MPNGRPPRFRRDPYSPVATTLPQETPREDVGLFRKLLAGGTRIGTGLVGSMLSVEPGLGTVIGGGIGGAGESAAQYIGGEKQDPRRIATEAGITALPLGKLYQAGKYLKSALFGGGLAGGSYAARQLAAGEEVDPTAAALHTAGGGALGALFARLGIRRAGEPEPPPTGKPIRYEVEPTSRKQIAPRLPTPSGETIRMAEPSSLEKFQRFIRQEVPSQGPAFGYEAAGGPAGKSAAKAATEAEKATKEATARAQIAGLRGTMVPGTPKVSESISAPLEGGIGTTRATVPYVKPKAAGEGEDIQELAETLGVGPRVPVSPSARVTERPVDYPFDKPTAQPLSPEMEAYAAATRASREARYQERYAAWIQQGQTDIEAQRLAALGRVPPTPTAPPIAPVTTEPIPSYSPFGPDWREVRPGEVFAPGGEFKMDVGSGKNWVKEPVEIPPVRAQEPLGAPISPVVSPEVPPITPPEESPVEALMNFFKTRVDAAGFGNRAIRAAKAAGEAVPEEGRAIAGMNLRREAQAAGLPTGRAVQPPPIPTPIEPPTPIIPPVPIAAPTRVGGLAQTAKAREAALAARKAKQAEVVPVPEGGTPPAQAKKFEELFNKLRAERKGEKGEVSQAALYNLLLGGTGAAVGAATDPLDDRYLSALAGAGAGLGIAQIPRILQSLGANTTSLPGLIEELQAPEGVRTVAQKVWQILPQIQRMNYLFGFNLIPNAIAGPWGSGAFSALEAGLSDDPRGWIALKKLFNPNLLKKGFENLEEAKSLIGRAEGIAYGEAANIPERLVAAPGTAMTAGDITVRNVLIEAGFPEDMARTMTLTSEPASDIAGRVGKFARGAAERKDITSPLAGMALPFWRTPANILEQGIPRLPALGPLAQALRQNPDSLRQIAVQQGLSIPITAGSYVAGASLSPEEARLARPWITNVAGRYSLPASIGFAAGQARRRGQPLPKVITTSVGRGITDLPLPTTQTAEDWIRFISGGLQPRQLPAGATPGLVRDLNLLGQRATPGIPGRPRRSPRFQR